MDCACFQLLTLAYTDPRSNFAFNFSWCPYSKECWVRTPQDDLNFTSLKLRFVEGLMTEGVETLKRVHKPLTADGM